MEDYKKKSVVDGDKEIVFSKANKGRPVSETEKLRHALRTAHRA